MTDVNACNCDDVEQYLCTHVEPGKFTVLPERLREHLDRCEHCWEYFCDLIILTGQLSRCDQLIVDAGDRAEAAVAMQVPSSRDPVRTFANATDERNSPMLEIFDRTVPQLPAILHPAAIRSETITVSCHRPERWRMRRRALLAASVCTVTAVLCFAFWPPTKPAQLPRHAILAEQAGKAFDAGEYDKVVSLAQECIDGFEPAAMRLQEKLQAIGRDLPTGVVSPKVRDELLSYGPLNDVAACYYYLGQAQRKLGQADEARTAYTKAAALTYARVWDPRNPTNQFFWTPAEDAAYWLKELSEKE